MKILILGSGCPKCKQLEKAAHEAVATVGNGAIIEKVTDIEAIMGMGVMMTPALVIDGEVKLAGRVPSVEDLKKIMK